MYSMMAACNACSEVVTLNQSMHRSFTPPLTGLLNFPIVEHFKDSEIWGHGIDGEGLEDPADLSKLASLLVRSSLSPAPSSLVCAFRTGMLLRFFRCTADHLRYI